MKFIVDSVGKNSMMATNSWNKCFKLETEKSTQQTKSLRTKQIIPTKTLFPAPEVELDEKSKNIFCWFFCWVNFLLYFSDFSFQFVLQLHFVSNTFWTISNIFFFFNSQEGSAPVSDGHVLHGWSPRTCVSSHKFLMLTQKTFFILCLFLRVEIENKIKYFFFFLAALISYVNI